MPKTMFRTLRLSRRYLEGLRDSGKKTDIELVRQPFQYPYFLIVICVRGVDTVVAHDLKGIHGNKNRIGMCIYKIPYLFAQPIR